MLLPRALHGGPVAAGLVCFCIALLTSGSAMAGELAVVSVAPALNGLNAHAATAVSVTFDRPLNTASVTSDSFRVFGRWSGTAEGKVTFSNADHTVTLTPANGFSAGENVSVNLSNDLLAADGSPMRAAGYAWRFWVRTRPACWQYTEIDEFSNRPTPSTQTRIYVALGSDLNNDGWLDITTVNEVSSDLRVCLNTADGSGLFDPFLAPAPGLFEMSPNEPADFNNDGNTDVAVCSSATGNVLIFLGTGTGAFQQAQIIEVGDLPLGICVLDADGDGDMDVANTNYGTRQLSILTNNGAGVFSPPDFFEGGGSGEYGLASADMNNDGLLDLVVGARTSGRVIVHLNNGAGEFVISDSVDGVGQTWQLQTGDVNGDGFEDVNVSCGGSSTAAILFGDGAGNLSNAVIHPVPSQAVATDLADIDGDGDLDWTISSFGGGLWTVFRNNGTGAFTQQMQFVANSNPACSTSMDFNNDGRIDQVLLDEIADVVTLQRNHFDPGDTNCDFIVNIDDLLFVIANWGACATTAPCIADMVPVQGDGEVNIDDLLFVISNWG